MLAPRKLINDLPLDLGIGVDLLRDAIALAPQIIAVEALAVEAPAHGAAALHHHFVTDRHVLQPPL